MVLGLDASTSCVGYSFTKGSDIIEMGFIDIIKIRDINEKALYVYEKLSENPLIQEIECMYIEDSLSGFARGRTSIQTIIKLAQFNAIIRFIFTFTATIKVIGVNPNTARKAIFGKARVKGKTSKQFVRDELEKRYDMTKWIKINKKGNFDQKNLDAYDATVVSLYHNSLSK
tara:strand:- start:42 stop:557 length:516 start_codon:yes stop_codon:yes gene_type:complete